MAFISGVTITAPSTPVMATSTAVSAGKPPTCSEMLIATAVVTDLGTSESSTVRGTAKSAAAATAETIATVAATNRAASMGTAERRTVAQFLYSGSAMATVAGPSRK